MSSAATREPDSALLESSLPAFWERALSPDEWADIPHAVIEGADERAAAEALVRKWRKVITARAGSVKVFQQRLEALGIAEEDAWRRFLPRTPIDEIAPPQWALILEEALSVPEAECLEAIHFAGAPTPEEIQAFDLDTYAPPLFAHFVAPFLAVFIRHRAYHGPVTAAITRTLLRRLSRVCARTAAYELKLARSRGDLEGADSHARYQFFCRHFIGSPAGRLRVLETYPVLARLMATLCTQWIDVSAEALSRLQADRDVIGSVLNGGTDPGALDLCLAGLSDSHCGGRTAWILRFESGLRIVYKPRSHRVDAAWQGLIEWINQTGHCLPLRAPKVVERDGYGWSEFIAAEECASEEQAGRYYQRQGTIAALVWLLCGQDFHSDNFVAAGEFPVPVDLEGLLAPGIVVPLGDLSDIPQALHPLHLGVAGSLMLPYWRAGDRDRLFFQSSGIGGSGTRPWPVKQPNFTGQDTDSLSVDYRYEHFVFDTSVPRLAGERVPVARFLDRVTKGFEQGYNAVMEHRDELLSPNGPCEEFRHVECRLLFRDTQDYASLLFWVTAPDLLTSGAANDVALESLAGQVPVFFNGSSWPEVIDEEKRSLWQRDIPIAYGSPVSTGILFPSGRSFGPIIPISVFEQMRQRLAEAGPTDCQWQQSIIHALFQLADCDPGSHCAARVTDDPALAAARQIADDLVRTAVRHDDGITWLSFARGQGSARVYPIQCEPWSLNGSAGNALFLANMASALGDQRYETSAREGLACAARILDQVFDGPLGGRIGTSAWLGSFGLVYALAASGVQLNDDSLIAQAVDLALRHTPERLREDRNPDFLTGAAGSIAVLGWLHGRTREPRLLQRARVLAETVRSSAVDGGREGWQVPGFDRPLLGMAHGSAGIIMALLRLYREGGGNPGDQWMLDSATAGLAHERAHFRADDRQWPNLQERDGRVSFMTGWCAGAAGIGLARLPLREQLPDDVAIPQEIAAAVEATRGHLGGYQHHMCCGESGRIAFLRAAGHATEAREAALRMAEQSKTLGYWRLQEFSESVPIPGLLSGVAGVGLTLISSIHPSPSEVLTLS